jgi:GTPase SAR1 family protein
MASGHPVETCPTIGLNVKMVKKGGVQMKCWDIGGQAQYRSEWGRYTRGCDVIIYVVDANAVRRFGTRGIVLIQLSVRSLTTSTSRARSFTDCWKTGRSPLSTSVLAG